VLHPPRAVPILTAALLALAACARPASAPDRSLPLVVRGATLWDGTGAPAIPDAVLVVDGGRIAAAGPAGAVAVPTRARVVDARGRWIIPGLVDSHIHFSQSASIYTRPDALDLRAARSYADELARTRAAIPTLLRAYLALGITTVVDVGGPFWTFDVRAAAATAPAPRVAVAGPLLAPFALPVLDLGDPPVLEVTSPEAARAAVARIAERGPDLIKVLCADGSPAAMAAFRPVLAAILAEAHGRGLRVAVHATALEAAREVVAAGADILVHDIVDAPVDDAFVALLQRRGVIVIPTLVVDDGYQRTFTGGLAATITPRADRFASPDVLASWRALASTAAAIIAARRDAAAAILARPSPVPADNLRRLTAGGVTIAAGSDAGNIGTLHGLALFDELTRMRSAGLDNRQVLLAATRDAARVAAPHPDFGTLRPGQRADFLVLTADPLADLAALERVESVAVAGVLSTPDQLLPPGMAW
jgi:imidazolonepropionase-like amidohydrolase